ncbi:unnamed protein product [Pleuronectes platessa]|uniref:Uncharacterized protein n=1 Tax=Pleuronectes platessa TaxID=8262 RepID=A0A9N7ZBN8_PLEPL|nr:unnamed protein product [Pleuronectes platessa]
MSVCWGKIHLQCQVQAERLGAEGSKRHSEVHRENPRASGGQLAGISSSPYLCGGGLSLAFSPDVQVVLPVTAELRGRRRREDGLGTGHCGPVWSGSLISEHSSRTSLTDQNRKHAAHQSYDSLIHCSPESKCVLKALRPLNHPIIKVPQSKLQHDEARGRAQGLKPSGPGDSRRRPLEELQWRASPSSHWLHIRAQDHPMASTFHLFLGLICIPCLTQAVIHNDSTRIVRSACLPAPPLPEITVIFAVSQEHVIKQQNHREATVFHVPACTPTTSNLSHAAAQRKRRLRM